MVFRWSARELQKQLDQVADRMSNRTLLKKAGAVVRESVRTNFAAGGRPRKWKRLKNRNGQPLRDTGRLQNSITSRVSGKVVYVGTNVIYAAVQHFGAGKGSFGTVVAHVRGHERTRNGTTYQVRPHTRRQKAPWGDIPARPFLLVQEEDKVAIRAVLADYIVEGKK